MSKYLYSLLFLCTCLTGCSEDVEIYHAKYLDDIFPNSNGQQPFSSDYLYSADPKIEAQKAIKRGDFRFYAIQGIGRSVPGVQRECITDINQIIPIEGTSEITYSYEENQFNLLANLYAEYYNTQIKYHLAEQGNKCFFYPQGK